jgi:hypothetical protein
MTPKIQIEAQKTKEFFAIKTNGGGIKIIDFKLYSSHTNKNCMILAQNQKCGPWNKMEDPAIIPHSYSLLILDKDAKNICWRKDSLFNK